MMLTDHSKSKKKCIKCNQNFFFLAQIEELGSEGRVEEAQGMMKLVEQLKEERELMSSNPSVSQEASGKPAHSRLAFDLFLQRKKSNLFKCCAVMRFHLDHRELCCAGETDGSVRGLRRLSHRGRCTIAGGRPPDGQAAHGLRQNQVHRGGAQGIAIARHKEKQTGTVGLDCWLLKRHRNKMNLLFSNESIID